MSDRTHLQLAIVEARTIAKHVPHDLPALHIFGRPTVTPTVLLCAVGDIGLSGRAALTARRWGADTLFADVTLCLRAANITFGNLESPLAGDIAPGKMFAAPITGAATLHKAGFNLVHLANNHVGEYGQTGVAVTLNAVRETGMIHLGAGENLEAAEQLVHTDLNGLRIGWLACGRTLLSQNKAGPCYWEFNEEELLSAVLRARPTVDVLIVSIHIGFMYLDYPHPQHKAMAEGIMAAGADLILMHHAHVLQGVQVTPEGRASFYSLGNFLFDWREGYVATPIMVKEQNEGAVFLFVLDRQGVAQAAALPTWIDDDCKVHWARGARGEEILKRFARISRDLEGDFGWAFERQRVERNTGHILKALCVYACRGRWMLVLQSLRKTRLKHLQMLVRWLSGLWKGSMT